MKQIILLVLVLFIVMPIGAEDLVSIEDNAAMVMSQENLLNSVILESYAFDVIAIGNIFVWTCIYNTVQYDGTAAEVNLKSLRDGSVYSVAYYLTATLFRWIFYLSKTEMGEE